MDQSQNNPLSRALDTIKKLRAQLDAKSSRKDIAIVGVGLRLPGGIDTLDAYWEALAAGRNLVGTLAEARRAPFAARWQGLPIQGGYLDEVLGFDAAFFGVSPREARALDPQHRLLLEVAWEAFESAALPPERLEHVRTGLYLGVTGQDYRDWQQGAPDAYWATGNGHCFAAGRIAYALGLTGPTMAVDTACSSSLVALHLASQALRAGECDVALAGGVNLVLSPRSTELVVQTRSLAPDGLCKSFDARANGFTRGEGCGVLVLKPLAHAERDGDRVLAVIRGSALNQDGRSSGFTAPNVLAQMALLEAALADAGMSASDIGLIEAHGTGTSLGDPIEMEALVHALARKSGGKRLHVGSVKANIGHLEAAAGIAGVLKVIACLQRAAVPPLVHFQTLNPRIDLTDTDVQLSSALTPWDTRSAGAAAGVSSFGMSGTNAHVILSAPEQAQSATQPSTVEGFSFSAKSEAALRTLAARYATRLEQLSESDYAAFAYTAESGRARHAVSTRVQATDRDEAIAALRALARGAALVQGAPMGGLARQVVDLPSYPWERALWLPEELAKAVHVEPQESVRAAPNPGRALYELRFEPYVTPPRTAARNVLLVGDDAELITKLEAAAEGRVQCIPLPRGETAWKALYANQADSVVLLALRAAELPDELAPHDFAKHGAALCAQVTQATRSAASSQSRVFAITLASRLAEAGDTLTASDHGLLHGLSAALGLEFPKSWGGTIDLPSTHEARDLKALLDFVQSDNSEDVVVVRGGQVSVARLRPLAEAAAPDLTLRADATYLLTGGLGAIGRTVLTSFVERGARRFLVLGRTPMQQLADAARQTLQSLRERGAHIVYQVADCDDPEAVARALALLEDLPPLAGIVHGAGTLAPAQLDAADAGSFLPALRGKFSGAWWLHLATRARELDFFVCMSSVSAVWGSDGYGAYAAANGGLDAVMALRRARGLPGTSIAFGPWDLPGMADEHGREALSRIGVASLSAQLGTRSLAARVDGGAHFVACEVEWTRFASVLSVRRTRPLFNALLEQATTASPTSSPAPLLAELARLSARPRQARMVQLVGEVVARILGYAERNRLRDDTGFFELGMDSMMAVDLTRELGTLLGFELTTSELFDTPTIDELSAHLLRRLSTAPNEKPRSAQTSEERATVAASSLSTHTHIATQNEPVAIVGMAGRFPGADSIDELWEVLSEARDTVGKVPESRWGEWATRAGISSDQGGFLRDIARFDAPFFHIPAREADSLDPQHRLLLEVAWHALEHGGIDPKSLKTSKTGVFVGISNSDYARLLEQGGLDGLDAYFGTGTALSAAAGRIAYLLGLNGPALAVDTACSSSLVALHLGIQSLRRGESTCVLAGGVNVIAAPSCSVAVSRAHMLSPVGRCKTFAADADGFVRAEGCGVVVLKRLSDARRDGNRILALIHGSAMNQDGASSGLTVPSGKAQEAVIRAALDDAQLTPDAIGYLEAHGTGTSLGDPIEVHAAWAALSDGRKLGEPLLLGSIKSNIGHCESASGIAGVIKTVLALGHGELPKSLHAEQLNPKIKWDELNVRVLDTLTPWRSRNRPRMAGVSSFGFSGTNAHVIVGEAPSSVLSTTRHDGPVLLPLSAADAAGLERLSQAWCAKLAEAQPEQLASLAHTAAVGRAHLPLRRAVLGKSKEELIAGLKKPVSAAAPARAPRVAFLFSGQGSQYFGMGRELYESEPVFRAVIDRCDGLLAPKLGSSLCALMFHGEDASLINQTRVTQPALVAIELALAALWESWGVSPCAVLGHSVGEVAAAIHVGVLSLEDGLSLIAERARLMQASEPGAMLAVSASLACVRAAIADSALDLAALNGPESIVVAGRQAEIDALAARLKADKIIARPLVVSHAFHSRLMEPVLAPFERAIAGMTFRAPELPIISNLTGRVARADEYDAAYFCRHIREPVRFYEGAQALFELGVDVCLELGPDRTLLNLSSAAGLLANDAGAPSLRRGSKDRGNLRAAIKLLYERGQPLDFATIEAHSGATRVAAPLYPFAGPEHWTKVERRHDLRTHARHFGSELHSPQLAGRAFAFERTADFPAYLTDHRLYGTVVTPAASHLGTILSALAADGRPLVIEDLICPRALVIKDGERFDAQILLSTREGSAKLSVQSLLDPAQGTWQEHLAGRIELGAQGATPAPPDRAAFIASAERHIDGATFYRYFRELGYTLGPSFCWIADVWIRGEEALVRYAQPLLPDALSDYEIYPGLIDSCFQSIAGFMVDDEAAEAPSLAIPFAAEKLSFHGRPDTGSSLFGFVRIKRAEPLPRGRLRVETADLHLFTDDGRSLFAADEFRVRHAPRAVLEASLRAEVQHAYELRWVELEAADVAQARSLVVLADKPAQGQPLAEALRATGLSVSVLPAPGLLPADAELVIDTRFRAQLPCASADEAADLAFSLAETLAKLPTDLPYALLSDASPQTAPQRELLEGMLNAVEAEQSERRLLRLRCEPGAGARDVLHALAVGITYGEPRLSLGDTGKLQAARLVHAERTAEAAFVGSVLVTGGLGALGLSVARIAAARGASALVLMGRSAPDEVAQRVIDELSSQSILVRIVQGDVAKLHDCERAIAAAKKLAPLHAVLHLAGVNRDKALERLTRADFGATFEAKVGGALNLAQALRGEPLGSLILFSSVASGLGSAGQANYAAANGFLDGLAEQLRASGLPATAVNWGPWLPSDKQGMAATDAVIKASERAGLRALSDADASPLLGLATATSSPRLLAVAADFARYAEKLGEKPRARLVSALFEANAARSSQAIARPKGYLRDALHTEAVDEREDALLIALRTLVGEVLGDANVVDDNAGFAELGLDSIMAIDVRTRLSHALAIDLPATLAIDYPSVSALARFVHGRLFGEPAGDGKSKIERARASEQPSISAPSLPDALGELSLEQLLSAVQLELAAGE